MRSTLDVTTPCVSFATASFCTHEGRSSQEGSRVIYLHAEASCSLAIAYFSHSCSDLVRSLLGLLSSSYRRWIHIRIICIVTGPPPTDCILYYLSFYTWDTGGPIFRYQICAVHCRYH